MESKEGDIRSQCFVTLNNGLRMPIVGLGTSHIGDYGKKEISNSM